MQPDNPHTIVEEPSGQEFSEFPESGQGVQGGKTREMARDFKQAGVETARRVKEKGEAFLGEHKHTAADSIHHCGDALRGAAQQLRERQDQTLASFAEKAADQLERMSGYLDSKQIEDIRNDVEGFARRQPQVFYGGMFAAGLALSRFFKASQSKPRENFDVPEVKQDYGDPDERLETNPANLI